jgi:hypothetical protein
MKTPNETFRDGVFKLLNVTFTRVESLAESHRFWMFAMGVLLPTIELHLYLIADLDERSESMYDEMYDEEMLAGKHIKDKLTAEREDLLRVSSREFDVEFKTFYTSMIHLLEKRVKSYAVYGLDTISLV